MPTTTIYYRRPFAFTKVSSYFIAPFHFALLSAKKAGIGLLNRDEPGEGEIVMMTQKLAGLNLCAKVSFSNSNERQFVNLPFSFDNLFILVIKERLPSKE